MVDANIIQVGTINQHRYLVDLTIERGFYRLEEAIAAALDVCIEDVLFKPSWSIVEASYLIDKIKDL